MLSTENIGLKKPGYNDEADIAVINENSDIIDREFGNRYLKSETYSVEQANNAIAQAIEALPNGLVYRGAVNYYKDLPTDNNELGDTYSVKYQGETGTTADGNEYAWGKYDGTLQWIKLGVNAYTKDEIDEQYEEVKSDILINRETIGTQIIKKNLFNKDGDINHTYSGGRPSDRTLDSTVSGNVITVKIPLTQKNIAGQFVSKDKGKKIIVSGKLLSINSSNSEDMLVVTAYKRNDVNYLLQKKLKDIGEFTYTIDCENYDEIFVGFGLWFGNGSAQIENVMVRYADTDGTYEPYKPSLQEQINALVERIQALETAQTQNE